MATFKQHQIVEDLPISEAIYSLVVFIEEAAATVSKTLQTWAERSRDRRYLAQMDSRQLSDVGLTRVDVSIEVNKFFWQK